MKACQLSSVWKILEKEFFYSLSTLILHRIKVTVSDFGDLICVKSRLSGRGYRTYHET